MGRIGVSDEEHGYQAADVGTQDLARANGPSIVFLHGGRQGSWIWEELIDAIRLQAGDAVPDMTALDVPGCGRKQSMPTEALTYGDVVSGLVREIEAIEGSIFLVGHSQAGTVIPSLANALGSKVVGIVWIACACPDEGQSFAELMGKGLHGTSEEYVGWPVDPGTVDRFVLADAMFAGEMTERQRDEFFSRFGADHWPSHCREVNRTWHIDAVQEIASTYVMALRDNVLPVEWQARFASRLGSSQTIRVDSGHQPMQTVPHATAEILLTAFRSI